jgi:hypothetical protein
MQARTVVDPSGECGPQSGTLQNPTNGIAGAATQPPHTYLTLVYNCSFTVQSAANKHMQAPHRTTRGDLHINHK